MVPKDGMFAIQLLHVERSQVVSVEWVNVMNPKDICLTRLVSEADAACQR
jgi:hypothetical protein